MSRPDVDPVLDVKGRGATRHALDIERRIDEPYPENDPEGIVSAHPGQQPASAIRSSDPGPGPRRQPGAGTAIRDSASDRRQAAPALAVAARRPWSLSRVAAADCWRWLLPLFAVPGCCSRAPFSQRALRGYSRPSAAVTNRRHRVAVSQPSPSPAWLSPGLRTPWQRPPIAAAGRLPPVTVSWCQGRHFGDSAHRFSERPLRGCPVPALCGLNAHGCFHARDRTRWYPARPP